jgi:hypothetical protein
MAKPGYMGYYPQHSDWVPVPADKAFTVPHSELAMHCRFAGKRVESVIVCPALNYAYVQVEGGKWLDGLLNEVMPPSMNEWAVEVAWRDPVTA